MKDLNQAIEVILAGSASLDEAAQELQVAEPSVRVMLHRGQLEGLRIGRTVRISHEELDRFKRRRDEKSANVTKNLSAA